MQPSEVQPIRQYWQLCQRDLFPVLEEQIGGLSDAYRMLAAALALLGDGNIAAPVQGRRGRPALDRLPILRAFVAKAFLNLATTRQLLQQLQQDVQLRQLCGWNSSRRLPSESMFSRVFAELAASGLVERLQTGLVQEVYRDHLVGHVIRDATAVPVRQHAERKKPQPVPEPRRRGRPRKGETPPASSPSRIQRQSAMTLEQMLQDLPRVCDWGLKLDEKGRKQWWKGFKFHCDISDAGLPLSCVLTSASLHDSQAAIPLATVTSQRVQALYELMDAGYHSQLLRNYCEALGHVVLIPDVERQGKPSLPMAPAQRQRYALRTLIERFFARLKDDFGLRHVRVRGHAKVQLHVLLAVLMFTLEQILRMST